MGQKVLQAQLALLETPVQLAQLGILVQQGLQGLRDLLVRREPTDPLDQREQQEQQEQQERRVLLEVQV